METKNTIGKVIIFILLVLSMFSLTSALWYDIAWFNKIELNISTISGTAPINYSTLIELNSSNLPGNFNWNQECVGDSTKIRIVDPGETYAYSHFVESCSIVNQTMDIWVNINSSPITTAGIIPFLYYNNPFAISTSNPEDTFDHYFNLSSLIQQSESSGATQDISGGSIISANGRQINIFGNAWKVFSGFSTIPLSNTGDQRFEYSMFSADCGEISAIEISTGSSQTGAGGYRACGSQTNWGRAADQQNLVLNSWEKVYSILNDFTMSMTHLHIVGDDDADASTNSTYKDLRIRKHLTNEPLVQIGTIFSQNTSITSLHPQNTSRFGSETIEFTCFSATNDPINLTSVSLYTNQSGVWSLEETKNISGIFNSTKFNVTFPLISAKYHWNCEVSDSAGFSDFFETNYSLSIDLDKPVITYHYPLNQINDVTPVLNVEVNELVNLSYSLNGNPYENICHTCNFSNSTYIHVEEGNYSLNITAIDEFGRTSSVMRNFTVNMNYNYFEKFIDNSSIKIFDNSVVENSSLISKGNGVKYYQGIEFGYNSGNLLFIADQWGGGGNRGEVDITCPGGDFNCWFEKGDGTNISTIDVNFGIATADNAVGQGYILYSVQDVHTRLSPAPHASNGDNLLLVCFIAGSWFYDDNNGCNEPFSYVSSDVLIANVTLGVDSVTSLEGVSSSNLKIVLSNEINTTQPIMIFKNITWEEYDTNINNSITVQVSPNGGINWYNAINGQGIENISNGTSLQYNIIFNKSSASQISLDSLNITWSNRLIDAPFVELLYPINNIKILNKSINFSIYVEDNTPNIMCDFYLNSVLNRSFSCPSGLNYSFITQLESGRYIWGINATDQNNDSTYIENNFTIIHPQKSRYFKEIIYLNSNQYFINLSFNSISQFTNIFGLSTFSTGSYSTLPINSTILLGVNYFGTLDIFNQNSTYSIAGISNYSLEKEFILGGE